MNYERHFMAQQANKITNSIYKIKTMTLHQKGNHPTIGSDVFFFVYCINYLINNSYLCMF